MQSGSAVPARTQPHGRVASWIALSGIAVIALAVRYLLAAHRAMTADEIYILFLARRGFGGMMSIVGEDVEQPLYYALAWLWRLPGGDGALWAKSLPILAGVAGVLAVVPLGRRMFGSRAAWLAALLLALQRTHIEQSQRVVPSTVLWLFLTLAVAQAWAWFDDRRMRYAVGFVLLAAAAVYTYWFAFVPLAVLASCGLVRLRGERAAQLHWLGLCALVLLLFAPLAPTWWAQALRDIHGDVRLEPLGAGDLWTLARKLYYPGLAGMVLLGALSALPLVPPRRRGAAALLASLTVFSVLTPFLMSRVSVHLFFPAQAHFALPFVCLLIAAGVESLPGPALAWLARVVVVALALRGVALLTLPTGRDPHLEAVDYLRPHVRGGDVVLCVEPHSMLFFEYYLPGPRYRLMVMPGAEPFHHSDAVLAIPASERTTPLEWSAGRLRGERWWGLRFEHFPSFRTGAGAAAMLAEAARGPVWKRGPVTIWAGTPPDSVTRSTPAVR